jgi:hypothetical protein
MHFSQHFQMSKPISSHHTLRKQRPKAEHDETVLRPWMDFFLPHACLLLPTFLFPLRPLNEIWGTVQYGACDADPARCFTILRRCFLCWWRLVSDSHEYKTMATANGYSKSRRRRRIYGPVGRRAFSSCSWGRRVGRWRCCFARGFRPLGSSSSSPLVSIRFHMELDLPFMILHSYLAVSTVLSLLWPVVSRKKICSFSKGIKWWGEGNTLDRGRTESYKARSTAYFYT